MFNNSGGSGNSSVIDAIQTPVNGYTYSLTPGSAYSPSSYTWRHDCIDDASGQSAHNRMSNGNTFVNLSGGQGSAGYMYEVDSNDNVIWQYNGGGPSKAFRYECAHPGIIALLNNPCGVNVSEILEEDISVYPNPSSGIFTISGLEKYEEFTISVIDAYGRVINDNINSNVLDISSSAKGIYFVKISKEKNSVIKRISLLK
jgi:hypothetical protein